MSQYKDPLSISTVAPPDHTYRQLFTVEIYAYDAKYLPLPADFQTLMAKWISVKDKDGHIIHWETSGTTTTPALVPFEHISNKLWYDDKTQ
jgi:hypothetical protein